MKLICSNRTSIVQVCFPIPPPQKKKINIFKRTKSEKQNIFLVFFWWLHESLLQTNDKHSIRLTRWSSMVSFFKSIYTQLLRVSINDYWLTPFLLWPLTQSILSPFPSPHPPASSLLMTTIKTILSIFYWVNYFNFHSLFERPNS